MKRQYHHFESDVDRILSLIGMGASGYFLLRSLFDGVPDIFTAIQLIFFGSFCYFLGREEYE